MELDLVSKVELLCSINHISITQLEKELDLARGSIRRWNTNMPSIEKVIKISNFFHVSFDFLLGLNNDQRYLSKTTMKKMEDYLNETNTNATDLMDNLSYIDYKMFFDLLIDYSILNANADKLINNMAYSTPTQHPLNREIIINDHDSDLYTSILTNINNAYDEIICLINNSMVITNGFFSKSFNVEESVVKNQEYIQILNAIYKQLDNLKALIPQLFLIYSSCNLTGEETISSYNSLKEILQQQGIDPDIKMKDYSASIKELWD